MNQDVIHFRILKFALAPLVGSLLAGFTAPLSAGPLWDKPTLSLGSLNIDGGLRQSFLLGQLSGSPEFAFPIYLQHGFRLQEPVSEYSIPQLTSYVVPEGRDSIVWLEPGGARHQFKSEELLTDAPTEVTSPWVAVKTGPVDYDFHSDDGWVYRYLGGAIVSLSAPSGRTLKFETLGLQISRIFQQAGEKEVTLLEVSEDEIGLLASVAVGPVNHRFTYTEDSEQLDRWQSPRMGQNVVSFKYSPEGLLSEIALPNKQTLTYRWGGREGEWQKDSGFKLPDIDRGFFLIADDHFRFQYGISREGLNLMRTNVLDQTEGFCFNPKTQQMVSRSRDGGISTQFYGLRGDSENQLETVRDQKGREAIKLTYDEQGRVATRKVPGQAIVRFEYDELDRISKVYRLEQLQKSYQYDGESDRPVEITNALGDSILIAYQSDGQIKRFETLDGAVYEFRYDDLGQLTEEIYPMGYSRTIERDHFGRIVKKTNLNGDETIYHYDEFNQLASVQAAGTNWDYQYDSDGVLTQLLRDGETWQRIERTKLEKTGESVVKQVNFRGDETVLQFDSKGNLTRETDPLGQSTDYQHNELGQLQGWKDGRGVVAEFERDTLGRVAEVETEGTKPLQMAYDQTGRLTRRKTGEQDIRYRYNKEGQLRQIDYGKGETINYEYDQYGRILVATTSQGVKTTYTWDELDRKTSERNDIPGGVYTLVKWEYTPGNRKAMVAVYQNGDDLAHRLQETRYQYDLLGRYKGIFVDGEQQIWYDYEPKTRKLARKRFANGWTIAYGHHPTGRPASILAKDAEGKTITDVTYLWGDDGKLASRTLNGVLHEYQYDQLGRLTAVDKREIEQKNSDES